ncbi:hypothetical protein M433DRAFT_74316 [Acidomyces richmondensis BFW]|nr:hypothetical protein M433DRAFT_74316 [Acidomyces richmondensis BFW]
MAEYISTLEKLTTNPPCDPTLRKELHGKARSALYALESVHDVQTRIFFGPVVLSGAVIAIDMGLFQALSEAPQTVEAISTNISGDQVLVRRVLRLLSSTGLALEDSNGKYRATHMTSYLTNPAVESAVKSSFYLCLPMYVALPQYLSDYRYCNPDRADHNAATMAFNGLTFFQRLAQSEKEKTWFSQYMAIHHDGEESCWKSREISEYVSRIPADGDQVLMVDVGGGMGHQAFAFRNAYHRQGRIVVQDHESVIPLTYTEAGIEFVAQDFFTPQPDAYKNARIYYIRNVLHDWPDDKCIKILEHIGDAMGPNSVLMIDEKIVPNRDASDRLVFYDLAMMCIGGMERTVGQFKKLLHGAGLKYESTIKYCKEAPDGIIIGKKI